MDDWTGTGVPALAALAVGCMALYARNSIRADKAGTARVRGGNAGVVSGVLGIGFALLGLFTIGILFVPFAMLFTLVAMVQAMIGGSLFGIALALASGALTVTAVVASPTLLIALGIAGAIGAGAGR